MVNGIIVNKINGINPVSMCGVAMPGNGVIREEPEQAQTTINFTHELADFSPLITVADGAEILWTFPDESTSNTANPAVNFGTVESRETTLQVTPWSALEIINIGYFQQDGGSESIETNLAQGVSGITGLELVQSTLQQFCACSPNWDGDHSRDNTISELNFEDFTAMTNFELFNLSSLQTLRTSGMTILDRPCYEGSRINHRMDLAGCLAIRDIRGGSISVESSPPAEHMDGITFDPAYGETMWHFCIIDNQGWETDIPWMSWPNLEEVYANTVHLSGNLELATNRLGFFRAPDNDFTSANLNGTFTVQAGIGLLDLSNNQLTAISVDNCPYLRTLNLQNNQLTAATLDTMLQSIADQNISNIQIDITQNEAPTNTTAIATIESNGGSITHD